MKRVLVKGVDMITAVYIILIVLLTTPCLLGCRIEAVTSGSMEPAIPSGAVIYVKETAFRDIAVNDVITYWLKDGKTKVTHRVVEKNTVDRSFVTKGDSNHVSDQAAVEYGSIEGKVIGCVPLLGRMALLLTGAGGKGILALFLFLLALLRRVLVSSEKGCVCRVHRPDYCIGERRFE